MNFRAHLVKFLGDHSFIPEISFFTLISANYPFQLNCTDLSPALSPPYKNMPYPTWCGSVGYHIVPCTEESWIQFPIKVYIQVVGLIPQVGAYMINVSLTLFLPLPTSLSIKETKQNTYYQVRIYIYIMACPQGVYNSYVFLIFEVFSEKLFH